LSPLKFDQISEFSHYHYQSQSVGVVVDKARMRRLASEYSDLSESLPINIGSSIFVRINEQNIQQCQLLIIPPDHTPYAYGCFLFDVLFPPTYPNVSPSVNLQTTGGGTVRFNPNLYNCGKVCLSLLGTWQGDNAWDSKTSTFLQVAVSLQSLVFVPLPYYNEPGHEQHDQKQASDQYNANIRFQNVRHAMLGQLRAPPKGWADVIKTHFLLVRDLVIQQVDEWWKDDHLTKNANKWDQLRKDLIAEFIKLDNSQTWKPKAAPFLSVLQELCCIIVTYVKIEI